ncbi:MAG: DEAD/DEAH box helicase [Verrucomicrobiota bacterium]|nr:DEAD/DEAH box helicase [Verrucomicrobiota bacterium]
MPGRSPYDAGGAALRRILEDRLWEKAELCPEPFTLPLPTVPTPLGDAPVPSHRFLAAEPDAPVSRHAATLRPWQVTAVGLTWKQAFMLLGACQEKRLADGVFASEELLACVQLFRYAGALVARGRFLPVLARAEGGGGAHEARWQPALDPAELRRVQALSARLPPVFTDGHDPLAFTTAFLEELTDRLVRFSVVTTLSRSHADHGTFYSVHDAWFAALRGDDRAVRWDAPPELEDLRRMLAQWRRPVEGRGRRDATLLFRLDTPEAPEQPWFLEVALKDGDRTRPFPPGAASGADGAGESLLRALGQAGMLFPALCRAEAQARGYGCGLSAGEAHAFLTASAPLLEAAGYGVALPDWWNAGAAHTVTLELDAAPRADAAGGPHALTEKVDVNWTATLDGEAVSREELKALLQAAAPLVFFRGRWIQVNVRQLQDALRVSQRKHADSQSALDVVRLALGTADHGGLDVAQVRGSGWLDPFLRRLCGEQAFEVLPPPAAFCGELRPYQLRGFSWLVFLRRWGFGACLADDMGLGKTVQTLVFLLHEQARGEKRPVLLVGPMSVLGNWQREALRFAPGLRCLLHHGAQRWHGDSFVRETRGFDLVCTSYPLLHRDYADLRKVAWAGIVLDEAQNIKNPDTRQAQAARALPADYRIALTGTPMENHVGDLWSIMDFLNPGLLGKRAVFREKFFRPIQSGTDPGARSRLRRVTAPFLLRRLKTDRQIIADLPEKIESKVICTLTREQARLYEEVLENFRRDAAESEGIARRGLILAVLTRLKQVCNHPAHYLGQRPAPARQSGKLKRLEEMLEEIFERGESALVFTQYAAMGALLQQRLCETFGREMPFLHGGVPRRERDRLVQSFQETTEPRAFILSLKAGGTGLNLTQASHVFHYDRWWNPAVEDQATDRAFRIGQTRNVMVHKFICGGTLEERIDALIEHKTALASEIVSSGETFLTELSDGELDQILRLSETVIEEDDEQ